MYNSTVYGITYNEDAAVPAFVDVIIYDQIKDDLNIHKIISTKTLETSYKKSIHKETPLIEDLNNGVGIYFKSYEISDGFFDLYIGGTVQNKQGINIYLRLFRL